MTQTESFFDSALDVMRRMMNHAAGSAPQSQDVFSARGLCLPLNLCSSLFSLSLSGYSTEVNFKEVNDENKQELFRDIYGAIDTLAFTFGNV